MRLRSVSFRGLTRFTGEPVTIDLDALGPGLIALVGENGAGKSTAMESVPAALYRTFPTRPGSIYDYAHGRDAFIEASFEHDGEEIRVRLAVDAERRMTEGYVFLNGESLTTGRAAEFETEIEKRFGSMPLFLASVFAAQDKSGSFLLKRKAERKSLFIELLGLAALEVLAESARAHRAKQDSELYVRRHELSALESEVADLPALAEKLEEAARQVDAAAARLTSARAEETSALGALERARAAGEKLAALEAAADAAKREVEAADAAVAAAKARPEQIDADVAKRLRFVGESDVEKLKEPVRQRHAATMERIARRRESLEAALADVPDAGAARQQLEELADIRGGYEDRRRGRDDLKRSAAVAENEVVAAEQALKAALDARQRETARLERQAELMKLAPCTVVPLWSREGEVGPGADLAGTCPLLADAREALKGLEVYRHEGEIYEEQRLADRKQRLGEIQNRLALEEGKESPERGLSILAARERELHAAIAKAEAAVTARQQLAALVEEATEAQATLAREIADAQTRASAALDQKLAIENERADALLDADSAVEEAQAQLKDAAGRYTRALADHRAALEQSGDVAKAAEAHEVAVVDRERAEENLRGADSERAQLRARVDGLRKKESALEAARCRLSDTEMHLGDWNLLERALGKDGVQALEIDAAGPEVASLTNELLASCYGPRFSIAFETLREKKSAKGEYSETFDIRVFDAGAERAVEALSGGERVVVGEAIGLAIAILNARKSGIRWETLWRDETAGALDPDNAQAYVLMLRRARELGGFHQVVFVSHSPEVTEAADVRLAVAGGRITATSQREAA